jgi:hypothetical protein
MRRISRLASDMRLVRIALGCLAAYAIVFILVYLTEDIHRRDFDRAFFTWLKNRTPENEAALRVEQRKNEIIRLRDSAVFAAFAVVIVGGTYKVVRLVRRA